MATAANDDTPHNPTLKRTCHICGEAVESHVWYAKTITDDDEPRRIYACPDCFFSLDDDERESYYRERV